MGDFDALCLAILDAVERQQAEGEGREPEGRGDTAADSEDRVRGLGGET